MGFLCVHLQIDVYTIDGINSSDILCRQLSVQSVYFDLNTLSRQNYFFQRVWGVFKILVEIPDGWGGGHFCGQKMEIPERRGVLREIPSVVGVWIFSGTTQYSKSISIHCQSKFVYILYNL